jgi:hypothetical protein
VGALLGHDDAADASAPRQENPAMIALALLLLWRRRGCRRGILRMVVLLNKSATRGAAFLLIRHFFIVAD